MAETLFTSESVSEGHPDKICDIISDTILDDCLRQDPSARVACETMAKSGMIILAGEITTKAWVDTERQVRDALCDIGYDDPALGFDANTCGVINAIGKQSPDIAMGVDEDAKQQLGAAAQHQR